MINFKKEFDGWAFNGVVVTAGPYGARLSVEFEEGQDAEAFASIGRWPPDEWVSEACGEKVAHWCSEGAEEIYHKEDDA